jgi:hypothetical protein
MLQDFHFKIVHHPKNKHTNIIALSRKPIFNLDEEDFHAEIPNQIVLNSKIGVEELVLEVHGWCIQWPWDIKDIYLV